MGGSADFSTSPSSNSGGTNNANLSNINTKNSNKGQLPPASDGQQTSKRKKGGQSGIVNNHTANTSGGLGMQNPGEHKKISKMASSQMQATYKQASGGSVNQKGMMSGKNPNSERLDKANMPFSGMSSMSDSIDS